MSEIGSIISTLLVQKKQIKELIAQAKKDRDITYHILDVVRETNNDSLNLALDKENKELKILIKNMQLAMLLQHTKITEVMYHQMDDALK